MKVIILAGGCGKRLYPLSTPENPKQFLKVIEETPLIILTVKRFLSICSAKDIIIVTGEKYRKLTVECMKDYDLTDVNIICEPAARNTAPAIALAVRYCKDILMANADEAIFVAPSDHIIKPVETFAKMVLKVSENSHKVNLTLLGIKPTRPDNEYGYIEVNNDYASDFQIVKSFKEKPTMQVAEQYLRKGNYYWNAGMYGFSISAFENEAKSNTEKLYDFYCGGYEHMLFNFIDQESISIDYAIAEKSQSIQMMPMSCEWTDIGSFKALYEFMHKDFNGNVIIGNADKINRKNCLIIDNEVYFENFSL